MKQHRLRSDRLGRWHDRRLAPRIAGLCVMLCASTPAQELLLELQGDNTAALRAGDQFGVRCVGLPDVDGDGVGDLLVSAHRYNTTAFRLEGAAFVFSGATGAQVRKHLGASPNGQLGRALDGGLDVDADGVADYVVGESYGDLTFLDAGIVHVYSGATGSEIWTFGGERKADFLGESVALIHDVDGDGHAEIVATAYLWDNLPLGKGQCGRAYCWSGRTGALLWTYDGVDDAQWLRHCSEVGDLDGDGINDVGLGSIGTGALGNGAGMVEIVSGATGALINTIPGAAPFDSFGTVLAAGDCNGDGVGDLLIGAMNANNRMGRITVHSGGSGIELFRHDGTQKDEALSLSALRAPFDWNRDGFADYLYGSSTYDLDDCSGGVARLHSGRSGRLLFEFRSRDDMSLGPTLGGSVSMVDDLNGDAVPEVVIGAYAAGPAWSNEGRLYVFAGDDLFLQADQSNYDLNDPITIELRGGTPGVLGMIAVTEIDGVALFAPIVLGVLDGNGELAFNDLTDSSYLGHSVKLMGWCQGPTGRGLVDSNLEWFRF